MLKLENWSLVFGNPDPWLAPELQHICLHGKVFNHPNHGNGTWIRTSRIIRKEKGFIVTHSGSKYELGKVNPDYEKEYPGAKDRLLLSLDRYGMMPDE